MRIIKKLKYMGKLKPCMKNPKILCVCTNYLQCSEQKVEKAIEK